MDLVEKGNIVLVDLRDPASSAKGHIPRSTNIPLAKLGGMENDFPGYKGAPIVFYSDNAEDIMAGIEFMFDWGYKTASRFPDGIKRWTDAGKKLQAGKAPTAVFWERKLGPQEVSIADFEKALADGNALIVDARTPDEFADGHFPKALNVPAEEAEARFKDLPKDKPVYIHCSTGSRAEMFIDVLKGKGYENVKFVMAHVAFDADGKGKVTD